MLKRIVIFAFFTLDFYLLDLAIGYFLLGYYSPRIKGIKTTYFMGNYLLAIFTGILFILLTLVLIIYLIKKYRKERYNITG